MPSLETELIVANFLDSEPARRLGVDAKEVRRFAVILVASAIEDLGIEPRLLDAEHLRSALTLTARKLGRGDPLARSGGKIVAAFFDFLQDTEMVPNAYELGTVLDSVERDFSRLADSISDDQRIAGETKTIENRASKVGRNDPCPCGSGKKFKQCCGKAK